MSGREHRIWIVVVLIALLATCAGCGSLTKTEIVYARATTFPEEVEGFMRVATDDPILVNVAGTDAAQEKEVGGYLLIHEQDLALLIRNTQELIELKK